MLSVAFYLLLCCMSLCWVSWCCHWEPVNTGFLKCSTSILSWASFSCF